MGANQSVGTVGRRNTGRSCQRERDHLIHAGVSLHHCELVVDQNWVSMVGAKRNQQPTKMDEALCAEPQAAALIFARSSAKFQRA